MSLRGRKPELKVIEGNYMPPDDEALPPPPSIPESMIEEWRRIVDDLKERKQLKDAMGGILEAYIMAIWNMRKAQEQIDAHGPLVDAGKGILKQNPAISLLRKQQEVVLRLSAELGLTPASRSRGAAKPNKEDDDDQFSLLDI